VRLKTLLVAMLAAGLAASFAAAAPPPGRGNQGLALGTPTPAATSLGGEDRGRSDGRPTVVVLQGAFVSGSADASGAGSFQLLVERASKHGRSLRGRQVTVEVDATTRFGRRGEGELADMSEGDRLVVHARASRTAGGSALRLLARRVVVRPPAPAGP
jgi:hypothetical protein